MHDMSKSSLTYDVRMQNIVKFCLLSTDVNSTYKPHIYFYLHTTLGN